MFMTGSFELTFSHKREQAFVDFLALRLASEPAWDDRITQR
jgi:hypothetical protein